MDYKDKAKAYDGNYKAYIELINRLEDVKNAIKEYNYGIAMDILCNPYPEFQIITSTELAEPKDEKIRKGIIKSIIDLNSDWLGLHGVTKEDAIAWLKKQDRVKESTISQHENKTCKENDDSLTSEDERIRKEIKDVFFCSLGEGKIPVSINFADIFDWLEKQDETTNAVFSYDNLILNNTV